VGLRAGRSGQVRKISPPPGFDPRTVQPIGSRYTDYATRPTDIIVNDDYDDDDNDDDDDDNNNNNNNNNNKFSSFQSAIQTPAFAV